MSHCLACGTPTYISAFADQRGRPFFDLLSRVGAENPRRVVDLGCGPGNLTATLASVGPMRRSRRGQLCGDGRIRQGAWGGRGGRRRPDLGTEARHRRGGQQRRPAVGARARRTAGALGGCAVAGSWIAVQMPGNFNAPSHEAVREVARREPFANRLRDMPFREGKVVSPPAGYADMLTDAGCTGGRMGDHICPRADAVNIRCWNGSPAPRCGR